MFTATTLSAIVAGLVALGGLIKLVTYLVKTSRQRTYIKLKTREQEIINEMRVALKDSDSLMLSCLNRELNELRQKLPLYFDGK